MPRITITTDDETAIKVIESLVKARIPIEKIELTQIANGAAGEITLSTARKHHKRRDGKRAVDILVERMPTAGNKIGYGRIKRLLTDAGFAEGTAAPMISRLVRDGYLRLDPNKSPKTYEIIKSIGEDFINK